MKYLFSFFSLFVLCSCALDVDYHMPANRFDTPEVSGVLFGGDVSLSYAAGHKVTLGEVYEDIIFHSGVHASAGQYIEKADTINFKADLGFLPRLDFFYRANYDSTDIVGAKIQIVGSGRATKQNGFKLATTFGLGSENLDDDEMTIANDQNGTSKKITTSLKTRAYDVSLIAGHRFNSWLIVYLNNYYTFYRINGELSASDGTDYSSKGNSKNFGSLLGFRLGEGLYLSAETGYSKGRYEDLEQEIWLLGVNSGFAW